MFKDTEGFPEDLGFRFNPETGEAYQGINFYENGEDPVTKWKETGFTYFVDNWIIGPGIKQKAGILAFATLDTAKKINDFIFFKVDPTVKSEIIETKWDVFKVINSKGKTVPQYQILIIKENGEKESLNAGLLASTIIRAQNNDFAAELIRCMF